MNSSCLRFHNGTQACFDDCPQNNNKKNNLKIKKLSFKYYNFLGQRSKTKKKEKLREKLKQM